MRTSLITFILITLALCLPVGVKAQTGPDWTMAGANPQRTSWVSTEVTGNLGAEWYHRIEPYIPYKIQPVVGGGKVFVSSARGLYAFNSDTGALVWVYPTELPLGHSPTYVNGIVYVGGYDAKIHAVNATTGQPLAGYTPFVAAAGFETNPLIVNNTIYAGNRDGNLYALNATSGALIWKFQTGGPVLFSAAYKNGIVYFASNDAYAYAVKTADGTQLWKSQKLPGAGFHSYWPVVYTEKASGQDYVVFTGGENYMQWDNSLVGRDGDYFYPECRGIDNTKPCPASGTPIGSTSTAPAGDQVWTAGTVLIDVSRITNYLEAYPYRRMVFVLNAGNGTEYRFDSDGDGNWEYAPFTYTNVTSSGNKYPPTVNQTDGILYNSTMYVSSGSYIPRGHVVGWKFGTHFVSRVAHTIGEASDEPIGYGSGGSLIYWNLCCDRFSGAFNVLTPYGQPNREFMYWSYYLLQNERAPDYRKMYDSGNPTAYNSMDGWQLYSHQGFNGTTHIPSGNGIYGMHGTTQSPPIPYNGRVYTLRGNALIAWKNINPNNRGTLIGDAKIVPVAKSTPAVNVTQLKTKLETEIQKIVTAGPLQPGYHSAGFTDNYASSYTDGRAFGEIFEYFQNPADTVYTLLLALPHLNATQQTQVRTYLQNYYGPGKTYDITRIARTGWQGAAPRSAFLLPDDVQSRYNSPPSTVPACTNCGYWTTFPPFSFYAAYKYAQEFGNARAIFDAMSTKLNAPPSDTYLTNERPYILNLYLAGYYGYLELQRLAGYTETASVRSTYNHLLSLKTATYFSKENRATNHWWDFLNYYHTFSVAQNFMFLTPEVGAIYRQNLLTQVTQAMTEYEMVAPYWFVTKMDVSTGEGTFQHLYDNPALFQAKAWILNQPREELAKYLDAPAFEKGDLFYIQNLVATIQAPASGTQPTPTLQPTPTVGPMQGDADLDNDVDYPDLLTLLKDFGRQITTLVDWNRNGSIDIYDFNVVVSKLL